MNNKGAYQTATMYTQSDTDIFFHLLESHQLIVENHKLAWIKKTNQHFYGKVLLHYANISAKVHIY